MCVCVYMLLIFPRPASAWITCELLSLAFVPRLFVFLNYSLLPLLLLAFSRVPSNVGTPATTADSVFGALNVCLHAHNSMMICFCPPVNALTRPSYSKLEGFFWPSTLCYVVLLVFNRTLTPASLFAPAACRCSSAILPQSTPPLTMINTFTHRKTVFIVATSSQRFNRSSARSERTLFAQLDRSGCCGPRLGTRC